MKRRRWLFAVLSGATLVFFPATAHEVAAPAATAHAAAPVDERPRGADRSPRDASQPQPPPSRDLCRPGTPPSAPKTTQYYDHNPQLGPVQFPTAGPVGPLLAGYQRFGALTESQFLAQYTSGNPPTYGYPPASGFVLGPDGRPIRQAQTLLTGYRLDRFGFPGGAFLAPLGTPFGSRSLTPQSLNTPADALLANYHVYCVVRPFTVDSGPIAPWFAQPGMGTQFQLNPAYLPQAGATLNVTWLLQNGYLVEENLEQAAACPAPPRRSETPVVC
ncbi:TNT domain-containing protein [Micromonospora sp. NBC_01405]|uniref:TNT domain-containing protein n=1 Tax=Micromonospora sp. NBC_01405 TaxID=2903589 RepID=UPI0032506D45